MPSNLCCRTATFSGKPPGVLLLERNTCFPLHLQLRLEMRQSRRSIKVCSSYMAELNKESEIRGASGHLKWDAGSVSGLAGSIVWEEGSSHCCKSCKPSPMNKINDVIDLMPSTNNGNSTVYSTVSISYISKKYQRSRYWIFVTGMHR